MLQSLLAQEPGTAGCSCNGYLNNGAGQCKTSYSGCKWCYVGNSNTCGDSKPSTSGVPYSWSCQACGNGNVAEMPSYLQTDSKPSTSGVPYSWSCQACGTPDV